jgi:hypothetical protein
VLPFCKKYTMELMHFGADPLVFVSKQQDARLLGGPFKCTY